MIEPVNGCTARRIRLTLLTKQVEGMNLRKFAGVAACGIALSLTPLSNASAEVGTGNVSAQACGVKVKKGDWEYAATRTYVRSIKWSYKNCTGHKVKKKIKISKAPDPCKTIKAHKTGKKSWVETRYTNAAGTFYTNSYQGTGRC